MPESLLFIIQLLFFLTFMLFSIFAFFYLLATIIGAPYVPTPQKNLDIMFEFSGLKKGEKFLDLGSGDGRVVIEAVKKGAIATGVEINPFLVLLSLWKINKKGYFKKARIQFSNLYTVNFSKYDVIFVAGFVDMMTRLENSFKGKVKKGTRVICYPFPLPERKAVRSKNGVYKYIY